MGASAGSNQHLQFHASPPIDAGTGESEHLVRAMMAALARQGPQSAAEALQVLRRGYPDTPLAVRIAAMCADATQSPK